jgi:hypothetical protein
MVTGREIQAETGDELLQETGGTDYILLEPLLFEDTVSDNITLADTPVVTDIMQLILSENFSLSDAGSTLAIFNSLAADGIAISDSPTVTNLVRLLLSDNLTLADLPTVVRVINRTITENLSISDATAILYLVLIRMLVTVMEQARLKVSVDSVSNIDISLEGGG